MLLIYYARRGLVVLKFGFWEMMRTHKEKAPHHGGAFSSS